MKKYFLGLILLLTFLLPIFNTDAYVNVKGYYKSNGTYVAPHVRSSPNGLKYDNYSYTPSQGLYNSSYGTKGSIWNTPTWATDPDYYIGKSLYDSGSTHTPTYTPTSTYKSNDDCPSYGFAYLGSCYELPSNSKKSSFSGFSCNYSYDEVGFGLSKKCLPKVDNGYRIGDSVFCNYDYQLSYGSCLKSETNYGSGTGYTSSLNLEDLMSCPKNSSISFSDYTKCSCDTGYELNSRKDGCKKLKNKTAKEVEKYNNKICTTEFGKYSVWDSELNSDGSVMCECKKNYEWNTGRTSCSKLKKN